MKFIGFDDPKSPTIVFDCRDVADRTELFLKVKNGASSLLNYVFQLPVALFLNNGDKLDFKTVKENFLSGNCPKFIGYICSREVPKSTAETIIKSMKKSIEFKCGKKDQNEIFVGEELSNNKTQIIKIEKLDVPFKVNDKNREVVSIEDCGIEICKHSNSNNHVDLTFVYPTNSASNKKKTENREQELIC